jgi:aminopeptidase-like protein
MLDLAARLYPICRSITGDGLRATLRIIGEHIPLAFTEVPTGTAAFDWTIPNEWNLRRATLTSPDGSVIADTNVRTLHVVNYSAPMHATLPLDELLPHVHSLPDKPDAIPYRTSYYAPTWGFCVSDRVKRSLTPGDYRVEIDTTLQPGSLTYAECVIPGELPHAVHFGIHCCHPSLANDNLSGIVIATMLARELASRRKRYTYRFLFNPGTVGAIAWLSRNVENAKRIRHGLVLSCLGDAGIVNYKRSRQGDAAIDRIATRVLANRPHQVNDFSPYGYDERQYCSPGFDLPVGVLMRTPNGKYPEYHTSDDNLSLLREASLVDSLNVLREMVSEIESEGEDGQRVGESQGEGEAPAEPCGCATTEASESRIRIGSAGASPSQLPSPSHYTRYLNLSPFCEPQLGKRGLYSNTGGSNKPPGFEMALLWVLNQSDGTNDLATIARKSGIAIETIAYAAQRLEEAKLLRSV